MHMFRRVKAFFGEKSPRVLVLLFAALFGVVGATTMLFSQAATPVASFEAEAGTNASCAVDATDASASGGSAVQFGGSSCGNTASAGAQLPISYDLASLTGTVRYVATNGNDTTGTGSVSAPYASVSKAYSVAATGDSIVVRGGTYRQGGLAFAKAVKLIAYPGELPIFNGAQAASSGWTTEGSYQYHAYTEMPVTDGSGISFTTGQNLAGDGVGKYPDQAWIGPNQLQQVSAKTSIAANKFWVDAANNRLYMMATDVAKGNVELSQNRTLLNVTAPNTTLEGFRAIRYSNTASDYGAIKFSDTADNGTMRNVEVSDTAFIAVMFGAGSINNGSKMEHVSVGYSNWMGVSTMYTDNFTMDGVYIHDMNQFGEFTYSPQSGALKTSRTRYTKVLNSLITNNKSHGIWFDQSNYDAQVANNVITGNLGSSLFFEISDNLTLINNYITSPSNGDRAVKLAGSSGLKLINNTIVGGADPVGIYVDNRSIPGCSNPANALCANSYGSDRDSVRPFLSTMTWIPRLDIMLNNIIVYPRAAGYCGTATDVCITKTNGSANVALNTIIHKTDSVSAQTVIDGNVYANGTGNIINALATGNYTTTSAFATAMAGSPVGISGFEANGKYGNTYVNADGSPTAALAALHAQAVAVPTNATINQYIPAGTKHYGVLNK
ncbi:right-handed parallel beta-helix repeat-containing protein [Candidatus Saccharibacteria bacterium]|nr:MAG: right-handed parallel beta-helix repeat-containing protein [Candidatus Saccharibacteria bacterium]